MKPSIPDFSQARVLVVGDVMLDRYWRGPSTRVSPEAPVPVVKIEVREDLPGGAANVAINIASLQGQATVVGVTGIDEVAEVLASTLEQQGVVSDFLRLPSQTTITKLRVLSHNQQLLRLDFEDGFPTLRTGQLLERMRSHLTQADVVVLSDYGKGALRDSQSFIQAALQAGKPVLVDPKGTDFERYRGATLITPNLAEFQAVVGKCIDLDAVEEKGHRLLRELSLEALLVTRGEHGMSLLRRDSEILHLPTKAREVYDVTGAGDTVIGVIAAVLAAGQSLEDATALANQAAGIVVGKLGTAGITSEELRLSLIEPHETAVLNEEALLVAVTRAQARGETIVMTNGCFDILHAGHVAYLEQARRLGDRLIVAVNDDASVQHLKGLARPVNPLASRMRVLAGLAAVDWVVAFSEDTPERLICRVKPDFLVKGGDNDPAKIPGNHCVWEVGGEVVVLDYFDGHSTTATIRRIRQSDVK